MSHPSLINLVKNSAKLCSGESNLIITDPNTRKIGEEIWVITKQISNNSSIVEIPQLQFHGEEPPSSVAEMMLKADVIFGITTMSMAHTQARYVASQNGARYLSLPDYSYDLLNSPALAVNFDLFTDLCESIANKFSSGKSVLVETPLGTRLTCSIEGRNGNSAPGWPSRGGISSPPDIESNVSPVESTANGCLVVDGSIPFPGLNLLEKPIKVTFENGMAVKFEGPKSEMLKKILDDTNDERSFYLAEVGIGLNPNASLKGHMLEDEGCYGTCHIGIGSNFSVGGKNKAPIHIDLVIKNASLFVDDERVCDSGVLEPDFLKLLPDIY